MDQEENSMSFIGHLGELRKRIILAIIPVVLFSVIVFIYLDVVNEELINSLLKKEFPTYRFFCEASLSMGLESDFCNDLPIKLTDSNVTEQFGLSMWLAIVGGIILSIPWIIYQIWQFIKPALKNKELQAVRGFGVYVFLLLILGVLFGYYIVAPLCINFFGNYDPFQLERLPSYRSFFRLITSTVLACAIMFQLPIAIYLMSKLGFMNPMVLKKYRKHVVVVILVLSALITPPDFVSQVIVAIPVLILYEISIRISARIFKASLNKP